MKAKVVEIFNSIQGEGLYAGKRQLFVRFYGCNLRCCYCDTAMTYFKEMDAAEVMNAVCFSNDCDSVSLTGGEPLMQVDFLKKLLPLLREHKKHIYLETNGTLHQQLGEIIDYVDTIAMDFKLPSSTKMRSFFEDHKQFLKIALEKEVFIKSVIGKTTCTEDIIAAIEIIKELDKDLPFVLQPQHPYEDLLRARLVYFEEFCNSRDINVRIIPQLHKQLGVR